MIRRGSILAVAAALVVVMVPSAPSALGACYRSDPEAPGSVATCLVSGPSRYVVASASQWELRVYRGAVCTGLPSDIDSDLTRVGRTPSTAVIDFGAEPHCAALTLTGSGFMAVEEDVNL